jgi:ubiquinone/menaquinone biosynthesis C-methylase UbiE
MLYFTPISAKYRLSLSNHRLGRNAEMNVKIHQAYNEWASTYDADFNLTRDLDALITRKVLRNLHPESTLELGCGTGKNTILLSRISSKLQALDFSEDMIAQAKKKLHARNVSFILADISKRWPIPARSKNLVVCNLVLEHINNLRSIFSQAYRVLHFGGLFFISELHPFRQYLGKQANFQNDRGAVKIPSFVHNMADFTEIAGDYGFVIAKVNEWWHSDDKVSPPRLISFLFKKPFRPNQQLKLTK